MVRTTVNRRQGIAYWGQVLVVAVAIALAAAAWADEGVESLTPGSEELVTALGSDRYEEREAATQELLIRGKSVVPLLEKAARGDEPEVAIRSGIILLRIRARVTPDTPEAVVELVDHYRTADPAGKIEVLTKLLSLAPLQMAALLHTEPDPEVLRAKVQWEGPLRSRLKTGARESNDPAEIAACLEYLTGSSEHPQWMADLYEFEGSLMDRIKDMELRADPAERGLLLACYRRAGEIDRALALAREMGLSTVVASLSLLKGDPEPYVAWQNATKEHDDLTSTVRAIAKQRWLGNHDEALRLAKALLAEAPRKEDNKEAATIIYRLQLNGFLDLTLPLMRKYHPKAIDSYLRSTERMEQWVDLSPYPKDRAGRTRWRDSRIAAHPNFPDAQTAARSQMGELSAKLLKRGQRDEAMFLWEPLHEAAYLEGRKPWIDFLSQCPTTLAYTFAQTKIDESFKESEFHNLIHALGHPDQRYQFEREIIWNALKSCRDKTPQERFTDWATFFGYHRSGVEGLVAVWRQLIDLANRQNDEELLEYLRKQADLSQFGVLKRDLNAAFRAKPFKALDEGQQRGILLENIYLRDWDGALGVIQAMQNPAAKHAGLVVGVLMQAGRGPEAEELLRRAERRLGMDSFGLNNLAEDLKRAGLDKEAERILWRIVVERSPDHAEWRSAPYIIRRRAVQRQDFRLGMAASYVAMLAFADYQSGGIATKYSSITYFYLALCQALLMFEEGDDRSAEALLEDAFAQVDGYDEIYRDLFHALRRAGQIEFHDKLFERCYSRLSAVLSDYPNMAKTRCTILLLAANAQRRLEEAEEHVQILINTTTGASYSLAVADYYIAKNDKEKALEWIQHTIWNSKGAKRLHEGGQIQRRYDRLLHGDVGP